MDKEIGPLSRPALGELAASGFLAPGALVRQGSDGDWLLATEVKGLFSQPPPKSAEKPDLAGAEPVSAESPVPADDRSDSPRQAKQPSPSRAKASQVGWYCEVMGEQTGPLSSAQLKELAASGFLTPDVAVRKGVEGKWVPASRVKGLFPEASRAPGDKKGASPPKSRPQSQPSPVRDLRAKPAASRSPAAQIVWYYRAMGEEIGPLSSADLQELAKSGLLTPDTPIRAGAEGEWFPAGQVLGLFDEPSKGAPAKKSRRPAGPAPPQPASPSNSGDFLDQSLMVPLPDKPKSAPPSPEAGRPARGAKRTRLRGSP
jgi:hypothetical protein